jgi:tRNA-dihydrouridine synthase B
MNSSLADILNRPLNIGNTSIEKRLVLAPMAFLGNVAFRQLVQNYGGCGLMFTEMCSAKRIPNENRNRSACFRWRNAELSHLVCQIFGGDPMDMAAAARRIEAEQFFGVDINFGCSEVSICRQNCGAAILNTPDLAAKIVSEVRKAVSIPLFVNGDVFGQTACLKMIKSTGCDGVAIGRMAIARPWLFAEWTDGYRCGSDIYLKSALRLAGFLEEHFIQHKALRRFKKFGFYFSANFKFGHTLFSTIQRAENMSEAKKNVHRFFELPLETVSRPNLNFFN